MRDGVVSALSGISRTLSVNSATLSWPTVLIPFRVVFEWAHNLQSSKKPQRITATDILSTGLHGQMGSVEKSSEPDIKNVISSITTAPRSFVVMHHRPLRNHAH